MGKYLVTGAAGFIGSRVAELLLEGGHHVVGVDNLNDAYDVRLKHWRLARLTEMAGFTFEKVDITDRAAVDSLFEAASPPFDAVLNLAARAGVRQSLTNPHVYVETNIGGAINLLDGCRHYGVKKFLLASTSSLYGAHNPRPFREDADTSRVLSPYSASKKGAEVICHAYHHLYGLDVVIPRYFTVYGPAGRPDMSPFRFVQWVTEGRNVVIYGDGTQTRDFTYIDDIARGTMQCLNLSGFNIVNLGSDTPNELREALGIIEGLLGKKARIEQRPFPNADVAATWADISRARESLGWVPRTDLREGLTRLVQWYLENRTWASGIETGD